MTDGGPGAGEDLRSGAKKNFGGKNEAGVGEDLLSIADEILVENAIREPRKHSVGCGE